MRRAMSLILMVSLMLSLWTTTVGAQTATNDDIGEIAALQLEAQIQALNSKGKGQQIGGGIMIGLGALFLIGGLAGAGDDDPWTDVDEGAANVGAGVILGGLFGVLGIVFVGMGGSNKGKAAKLEDELDDLRHSSRIEHPRASVVVVRW